MNKITCLLLILLFIVAACGTKTTTGQMNLTADSDSKPETIENSYQDEKEKNKSMALPSEADSSIPLEDKDTISATEIIPLDISPVPIVDLISVSQNEDGMTTVEAVRELGPSVVQISTDTAVSYTHLTLPTICSV